MTTSPTSFLSEVLGDLPIPEMKLAYFRERLRNRLYDLIVTKFRDQEEAGGFARADLARRIGKRPEQISRCLGSPGNWTLDTVSDLLLAMRLELDPKLTEIRDGPPRNFHEPPWLTANAVNPRLTAEVKIHPAPVVTSTTSGGAATTIWASHNGR